MLALEFACPEDAGFLFEVYADTRREEMEAWGWPAEETNAFLRMQFELQARSYRMQFPESVTQVIIHEGNRVGRLIVSANDSIHLIDISLLTAYRNKGIGTAVITSLQQGAGLPIKLSVLEHNPAKRLYERLGFKAIGEASLYISMSWQPNMREGKRL
ncbi:GNAT family N-acetyltransferase [Paenibacillus glycanilyticus]|uniref:GNAT family N-acetyltransferase n=1 Tax=Paenibacillus glycanilyticus TaxID=126569 RepID=UPI00203D94AC|nr:GNAT family N-acetyltransferase [Paenibacillus glycanilyticus]MCM3628985.1 GNAT family N-acetyltransferase [Paenibacillus glycanilyticus]